MAEIYEVLKLTHLKFQDYEIVLRLPNEDTATLPVHEELVLKFRLVEGKILTGGEVAELNSKLGFGKAYSYAIYLLGRQQYPTLEISSKLTAKEFPPEIVAEVIAKLLELQLLDDKQYAASYVQHQSILGKKGPAALRRELKKKGVKESDIDEVLSNFTEEQELVAAAKLAAAAQRKNRSYGPRFLKQKIKQYLMEKGFSKEVADRVLADLDFEDEEDSVLRSQLEKLLVRHGKLEPYPRRQKVVQALMRKGFSYEEASGAYDDFLEGES